MENVTQRIAPRPKRSWRRRARIGAISGLAGGAAFAMVQELDLRVFKYNADDYLLLGGVLGRSRSTSRLLGMVIHAINSAALGAVYGVTASRATTMPGPVNGMIFALIENSLLYPVLLLEEGHPLVRSGELASYRNGTALLQEVLRHIAFGAAAGAVYAKLTKHCP